MKPMDARTAVRARHCGLEVITEYLSNAPTSAGQYGAEVNSRSLTDGQWITKNVTRDS